MKVYGLKIKDLINFISPQKVLQEGENYILKKETWNVMTKRSDKRYLDFWDAVDVAKIVVGLITDEVYGGVEVVMGELYEGNLVVYPKQMGMYTKQLNTYLECTPDMDAFEEKTTEVLRLISDEQIEPNSKTKLFPSVEYGFYCVED